MAPVDNPVASALDATLPVEDGFLTAEVGSFQRRTETPAAGVTTEFRFDDEEAGRSFFYNTLTNEGMYDQPPEWSQLEAAEAAKVGPHSQT